MHESERCKPLRWIPFAWMPVYNEVLAPDRSTQGYDGHPARCARLEHEAMAQILGEWDERTAGTFDVVWEGTTRRQTRVCLGAVVVDHMQLDKFTGSTCVLYAMIGILMRYDGQLDAIDAHVPERTFQTPKKSGPPKQQRK